MSVPLSDFRDSIRSLIGDDDPDFSLVSDSAIDSKVRLVVNSGKVHGYVVDTDGQGISAHPATTPAHPGWRDGQDYLYGYGNHMDLLYANPFTVWYDSSFYFYVNYTPISQRQPSDNDLTPTGNPRAWAMLVYQAGLKFVALQSAYHFRTRSVTETIAAPKDLLWDIQLELDELINGGQASERPLPLPLIAIGIRTLYSGLWWSTGSSSLAFEYLGFSLSY